MVIVYQRGRTGGEWGGGEGGVWTVVFTDVIVGGPIAGVRQARGTIK